MHSCSTPLKGWAVRNFCVLLFDLSHSHTFLCRPASASASAMIQSQASESRQSLSSDDDSQGTYVMGEGEEVDNSSVNKKKINFDRELENTCFDRRDSTFMLFVL